MKDPNDPYEKTPAHYKLAGISFILSLIFIVLALLYSYIFH